MKDTLGVNRNHIQLLNAGRPKVNFCYKWTKQPWEVLSLRGRLRTVEETNNIQARQLVEIM